MSGSFSADQFCPALWGWGRHAESCRILTSGPWTQIMISAMRIAICELLIPL